MTLLSTLDVSAPPRFLVSFRGCRLAEFPLDSEAMLLSANRGASLPGERNPGIGEAKFSTLLGRGETLADVLSLDGGSDAAPLDS